MANQKAAAARSPAAAAGSPNSDPPPQPADTTSTSASNDDELLRGAERSALQGRSEAFGQPSVQQSAEELLRSVYQLMKSVQGTTDVAGRTLMQIAGVVSGAWNAIAAEQERKGASANFAGPAAHFDQQDPITTGGRTADHDVARALRDAANALRDVARGLHRTVELFQGMAGRTQSSGSNNPGVQEASGGTQTTPAGHAAQAREYAAIADEAARGARAAAASAANAMSGATPANGDGGAFATMTEMV
jgi:hypothetical protein